MTRGLALLINLVGFVDLLQLEVPMKPRLGMHILPFSSPIMAEEQRRVKRHKANISAMFRLQASGTLQASGILDGKRPLVFVMEDTSSVDALKVPCRDHASSLIVVTRS